ncbi:CaiB/BaiF CoA transferase family protein [Isoalcanivorax beigongshangi]|uniref:CaiB/BaiF CoA transferase family protein n=1 Tax=Isoalcanivorax beigongshangi TaxID=3238810 RepID=A0ABV4AIK5_9GAMM
MAPRAPLTGIRVLDLTRLLPGPLCTQHLADLGADVIKIEDTGAGDYVPGELRAQVNRNKRGLRLDLKNDAGRELLRQLVADADVLVEGFRPGAMARLGLDYSSLAAINPRLVYCSISGYGADSALAHAPGHDLNYCALSGVAHQVGVDADTPALSNLPLADLIGGTLTALAGIQAALFDAQRTGQGRFVDTSITDGVLAHAVMPLMARAQHGSTPAPGKDTLSGALPCYGFYRTSDGRFMAVAALEKKFWLRFCELMNESGWAAHHRSSDAEANSKLRSAIAARFAAAPLAHWEKLFADQDCCVSPMLTLDEAVQTPLFRQRDQVFEAEHPVYGRHTHVASPLRMSGHRFEHRHAPTPGEHTDAILGELGCDAARIAALRASGAVS